MHDLADTAVTLPLTRPRMLTLDASSSVLSGTCAASGSRLAKPGFAPMICVNAIPASISCLLCDVLTFASGKFGSGRSAEAWLSSLSPALSIGPLSASSAGSPASNQCNLPAWSQVVVSSSQALWAHRLWESCKWSARLITDTSLWQGSFTCPKI